MSEAELQWNGEVVFSAELRDALRDVSTLPQAIEYARVMVMDSYKPLRSEESRELFVKPIYLPQYNDWYLLGIILSLVGSPPRCVQFVSASIFNDADSNYKCSRVMLLRVRKSCVRSRKFWENAQNLFKLMRHEIPFAEYKKGGKA